jgi:hypothetical protein
MPGGTPSSFPTSVGGGNGWAGVIQAGLNFAAPIVQQALLERNLPTVVPKTLPPAPTGGGGVLGLPSITDILQGVQKGMGFGQGGLLPGLKLPGRKHRRMNVLNARALRRSIRRVQGFSKFARKSFVFEKRVKMKKRKR